MKLGIVTYMIAAEWDLDTIIKKCEELGYEGVELRTQHKHNVESDLTKKEREEVRKKFENSKVKLVGLGTIFEYHSPDKEILKKNIEGTKEYVILAKDIGAEGIKVRPNAFPEGISKEKTIEQIGKALREVSSFASDYGIKIRLEVHGREIANPVYIKQIIDIADHPNCYVCWNSNMTDLDETGSIEKNFNLLKDKIDIVHINELCNDYPWIELFKLLKGINFKNFCLAEILSNPEPERFLRYYKSLYQAYLKLASFNL
ncbi:MAG: sugar phosphate isomerase/epimerase [Candidatus Omnitrophica bacterium]|nr:sugar phosphate isomerase/epimerase [Candidatus Omnitrophota bacterium]MCM8809066.1 sugar phosphate isomerase/epimerase [Candidatus Omnitrophota bacterium]MCM8810404.1 sugar phosphate isomerase/epimerase [Candidatus Omnitrophota bacterium]